MYYMDLVTSDGAMLYMNTLQWWLKPKYRYVKQVKGILKLGITIRNHPPVKVLSVQLLWMSRWYLVEHSTSLKTLC